jgi:REP element-mobilizing transposase RayT
MTADSSAENPKQRLRRLDRIFVRTPIYYVTTCTDNRREILACVSVHQTFIGFAKEGPHHGAWVGAYVCMPDHLHAFVALDDQKIELAAWMKSLKIRYRRRFAGMELRRRIGKKISSIMSSEVKNRTRRSGTMCERTRSGRARQTLGRLALSRRNL